MFSGHYEEWIRSRLVCLLKYVHKSFFADKTLLEIGGGHADVGKHFLPLCKSVTSTDGRKEHVDIQRQRYPQLNPFVFDCDNNLLENKYDIILHWGTLNHLSNIERHLTNILERCDILLLESIMNFDEDESLHFIVDRDYFDQSLHQRGVRPSNKYIESLLNRNQFNCERISDPILNCHSHRYDLKYPVENLDNRSFWICWKKIISSPLKYVPSFSLTRKLLLEVGAHDGYDTIKYYNEGYRVFAFEPRVDMFKYTLMRTFIIPDITLIQKAVYTNNGITKFNICKESGASSILEQKSPEELEKHWGGRTDIQYSGLSYDVETIRLDKFIEDYHLQDSVIDFIHIDAQGVDLEVLQSLGKYLKNLKAGVLETVKDPVKSIYLQQNITTLDNVTKFLMENNFKVDKVDDNDPTGCEYNVYFSKINTV